MDTNFIQREWAHGTGKYETEGPSLARKWLMVIIGILILFGLHLSFLYNYLLFHSVVEMLVVMVAWTIFVIAWNCRRIMANDYLLFLGIAYLFVGGLELVHTLAYKGMEIFYGYDTDLATQLWIAARYMESLSFLVAPLFFRRRLEIGLALMIYTLITLLVLGCVFYWRIFPICFVDGVGLTPFKKISEYIISFILIGAIYALLQKRKEFDEGVFRLIVAAIVLSIAAELAFTFYIDAYGVFNLGGHYFKLIATYLIYRAIIETGLTKPYTLMFRDLKLSEKQLKTSLKEKEVLLQEVHHRVKNDMQVIMSLLKLQSAKIKDKAHADMFEESRDRIKSMALIHEKLYQTKDFANIGFREYVKTLSNHLVENYATNPDKLQLKIDAEEIFLRLDKAIPCGLIINELISNALKYAFPEDGIGEIKVTLRSINDDEIELMVSDDGIGIPAEIDLGKTETLGLQLVQLLAENQLDGTLELDRDGGTAFRIRLKN